MKKVLQIIALASLAACADTPSEPAGTDNLVASKLGDEIDAAVATLRRATDRYHNLEAAKKDGFVLLHPCEVRDEGAVGIVYVNFTRVLDGVIDPALPDALVYEPTPGGPVKLVAAEFAVLDSGQSPPSFLGHVFQREDEFGVFGLHVWVWKANPNGMFAETNPRVSCD
jgi:hypothetical protein